jgi:dihydroorotase
MPNTSPPIDNVDILKNNIQSAAGNIVDVYNTGCATVGRKGEKPADIDSLIRAGALAITDDGSPVADDNVMREVLNRTSKHKKPFVQHCEVMSLTSGGIINEGEVAKKLGVKGIPNSSEYTIIERDIGLTREISNAMYHVQHISTKEAVSLIRNARREGLSVSAEACPHHFILSDEAVLKYGTNAKMNPPLRSKEDVNEVIEGLRDGTIGIICTDHAPHSKEEKDQALNKAPFGIVGLETAIGLAYSYLVDKGIISLDEMINKFSANPRKLLGLNEIKITEGEPANLTILDIEQKWKVDKNNFHSKSNNTPFDGWELKCKPVGIVNNGQYLINV